MAGRPLAPFLVVAALAGLAFAGSQLKNYELDYTNLCNHELTRLDAPPADILFIGNSRLGAAVDPVFIGETLSAATGAPVAVERLTLTYNDIPPLRVFTRDYLRERGAPDIAIVQLTYNRDEALHPQIDAPIHPPRDIAFAGLADLADIQETAEQNRYGERISRRYARGYRSLPAMLFDRATMNIYAALRYPAHLVTGRPTRCEGEMVQRQADIWLYGTIEPDLFERDYRTPSDAEAAEWDAIVADYMPLEPAAEHRRFENDQLRRLIATLRENGADVYLTFLPSIHDEALSDADRAALADIFPDTPLIDLADLYASEGESGLATSYRDEDHVDIRAGAAISRFYAARLAELYR